MTWSDGLTGPAFDLATAPESPLLALAGPGTGKTFSLVRRVARLLEEGCPPEGILVLTFARTAARDLQRELRSLTSSTGSDVPSWTVHGFCFSLLSRHGVLTATDRVPRILADFERDILLADLEPDARFGTLTRRRELTRAFEGAWARRQVEAPGDPVTGLDQQFQAALVASLRWNRAMLVGELVPLALNYLRMNPSAAERETFRHVVVDEYQDLNRAEQDLVEELARGGSLTVIGDDDQSIYAFKWANPDGIRNFQATHSGTRRIPLEECRRCPTRVVSMATALIAHDPHRLPHALTPSPSKGPGDIHHVQWTSLEDEAIGVARFLDRKISAGVPAGECLVLAPSRIVGYRIRDALRDRGVAVMSYFNEEPIEDVTAQEAYTLLLLLADPTDTVAARSWLAFRNTSQRRGPYRRVLVEARTRTVSVVHVLDELARRALTLPYCAEITVRWTLLQERLTSLRSLPDRASLVEDLFPEGVEATEILRTLALGGLASSSSVGELVSHVRTAISQPEVPIESAESRVMSFHKSKGLTARIVVLAGLVEGLMPFAARTRDTHEERQATLEESRRLFYVGLTRVRESLVLSTYAQLPASTAQRLGVARNWVGGGYGTTASRFLSELGTELPRPVSGPAWTY